METSTPPDQLPLPDTGHESQPLPLEQSQLPDSEDEVAALATDGKVVIAPFVIPADQTDEMQFINFNPHPDSQSDDWEEKIPQDEILSMPARRSIRRCASTRASSGLRKAAQALC